MYVDCLPLRHVITSFLFFVFDVSGAKVSGLCVCVSVCRYTHRENIECLPLLPSALFFKEESLPQPKVHHSDSAGREAPGILLPLSPTLVFRFLMCVLQI